MLIRLMQKYWPRYCRFSSDHEMTPVDPSFDPCICTHIDFLPTLLRLVSESDCVGDDDHVESLNRCWLLLKEHCPDCTPWRIVFVAAYH